MAGSGPNAPIEDEVVEKTLAMSSPTFAEGQAPPSPISVPPPAAPTVPEAPLPNTKLGTSPVPFPPAGTAPRAAPRAVAGAPRATGQTGGNLPLKRPQTVIGLAPPPATQARAAAPTPAPSPTRPDADPFGLDEAASDAARTAIAPTSKKSPLASTGFAAGPKPQPQAPKPQPKPIPAAFPKTAEPIPNLADQSTEEESTRAVSREELLRADAEHVVFGEDQSAASEERTLAVGAQQNSAAAFAKTMARSADDFLSPSQRFQQQPAPPPPQQQPPAQSWNDPATWGAPPPQQQQMAPQQDAWSQQPQDPNAWSQQPQDPNAWSQQPQDPNAWSQQPQQPNASFVPQQQQQYPQGSMQPGQPHMMMQQPSHMPMQPSHMPQQQMSMGPGVQQYSMQPQQPGLPPPPWAQTQEPQRVKISGQIILLAVVGVICLAIFITGIVLFATTKF